MDSYNAHSPFTIRLELLKLAQSIESDRVWTERNRIENDWAMQREKAAEDGWKEIPPCPKMPEVTYEDVIRVANELNKFVSNKG